MWVLFVFVGGRGEGGDVRGRRVGGVDGSKSGILSEQYLTCLKLGPPSHSYPTGVCFRYVRYEWVGSHSLGHE